MKQLIFVAMMAVSSLSWAEGPASPGSHGDGKAPQTNPVFSGQQSQKPDPFTRLNQLVNACLLSQGNARPSSNLSRAAR